MATYVIYAGTADGYISSISASYPTANSGTGTTQVNTAGGGLVVGNALENGTYYVYEAFVGFDTSAVVGTVSSVALALTYLLGSAANDTVQVRPYDWGATLEAADFRAGATLAGITPVLQQALAAGLSINAAVTGGIVASGATRYVVAFGEVAAQTSVYASPFQYLQYYSADNAGTTNDPRLTVVAVLPSIGRPNRDVSAGGWTTHTGGTTALYATIDESVTDDTDYIRSPQNASSATAAFGIESMQAPAASAGAVLRLRARLA